MKKLKKNGFTLIELLVVITIIGILTIITVSSFVTSQQRSRDAARKGELKSLSDALNMYYADNGVFPEAGYVNDDLIGDQGEFSSGTGDDRIIYMKKVPKGDASGTKAMYYETSLNRKSFRLYTNLENEDDGNCTEKTVCDGLGYGISSGSCCYIITSSNASLDSLP
jgi:general secretion pathway protein G